MRIKPNKAVKIDSVIVTQDKTKGSLEIKMPVFTKMWGKGNTNCVVKLQRWN